MNLEINLKDDDKISTVSIRGEIDFYSSPQVRKEILKLTKQKKATILVDLAEVRYMDSSGVATFIEALQHVNQYNGRIALVGLRDEVKEVFILTRLDKIFEIHKNMESALGLNIY